MPTKRRAVERPLAVRLTPETVETFRRIEAIAAAGQHDLWEAEGGRRREWLDLHIALARALGLTPWHYLPTDVASEGGPGLWEDPERHSLAQRWRRALEAWPRPPK